MASRPPDRMVPVELVEDDGAPPPSPGPALRGVTLAAGTTADPDAVACAPTPEGDPTGASSVTVAPDGGGGRPAALRWAAAGVVLAATAGALLLLDPGDQAGTAAVGVLSTRWTDRWSAPADRVLAVRDGIVTVTSLASREPMLRGLDQQTGEQLWSVLLDGTGPADTCGIGVTLDPPTAWCWREPHLVLDPDGEGSSIGAPALVGIDLSDGSVASERELEEASGGSGVIGRDLVLADRAGDTLVVRRVEPYTWQQAWATQIPLEPRVSDGRYTARIEVAGPVVVVRGPTTAVLAVDDGRVLGSWTPQVDAAGTGYDGAEVAAGAWGFAAWVTVADRERVADGTWSDTVGSAVGIEGRVAEPRSSDGSVPEVLLLSRNSWQTLVAVDLDAGTELWRTPLRGGRVVARHDGAVVVAADGRLRSLETLTGIERWSVEMSGLRAALGGLGDGHAVVVTSVRDNRWYVDAVRLADGAVLWTTQVPGTRELEFIAFPPALELADGHPVVWIGRTLVWTGS